jgi:hypothetical protein
VVCAARKFFFIHVMKTAGGTLRQQILANFEPDQVYPLKRLDPDMFVANSDLAYLASLPAERRQRIRVFTGHFPFVAVDLLGMDLTTITVLRDPVERTLSYLRACLDPNSTSSYVKQLEEIYEDPLLHASFISNHQAKLFALTTSDRPASLMEVINVDARRLEIAKANLERVDVLGVQERFSDLLGELKRRFGWRIIRAPNQHVNPGARVPDSFRRRIADDNQADVALFEHALRLCERRGRAAGLI